MSQVCCKIPQTQYETPIINSRVMKHTMLQHQSNKRRLTPAPIAILLILGLLLWGFVSEGIADAALSNGPADIIYSARYYKAGVESSHYKIWRTDPSGSKRIQVTTGKSEDRSPIWLADGKTILFVREAGKVRTLCTVDKHGGAVTNLAVLPPGYLFLESVSPDRGMVVYLVHNPSSKLFLFDIARREHRQLGDGCHSAWSPDSRKLYITAWEKGRRPGILDVTTGTRVPLTGDFRTATWLNNDTLVAETDGQNKAQVGLTVLKADGKKERDVLLPSLQDSETDGLSPFADKLFPIPGHRDVILYGLHAGISSTGPEQKFYRIDLKGGRPIAVTNGRNLVWSPDQQLFLTGDGQSLAQLDRRRWVWVSPLSAVSLATGKARTIVHGLVDVGDFDWKPRVHKALK